MITDPKPEIREFDPDWSKPTAHTARALFAQVGDVVTWSGDVSWRWDGEQWHQVQPGDVCRNARDGSAIVWTGDSWKPPRVDNYHVDQLARFLDPSLDQRPETRELMRELARRALAAGYVFALDRPDMHPAAYHVPRLDLQPGDLVDITWTNGRTTHHVVHKLNPDGPPTLRGLPAPGVIQP